MLLGAISVYFVKEDAEQAIVSEQVNLAS
jgi:hypothetical protein